VEEGGFKMLAAASAPIGTTFSLVLSFLGDLVAAFAE